MAILSQTQGGGLRTYETKNLCPEGTFAARCIDYMETFGVEEPGFDNPNITVKKDKIRFLFAIKAGDEIHLAQTFEFNISGSPKSKLVPFIKTWLGKQPPPAMDTLDLIGKCCQISISHKTSKVKGTTYAAVEAVSPLMDESTAPAADSIEIPGGARAKIEASASTNGDSDGDDENPF